MPAGKRQQTSAMLYTLITFVGLFIATTTVAVIYYVKFEEQRTIAENSKNKLDEMATPREQQRIGTIIGTIPRRKSGLGTMSDYLDKMVNLIIGGPREDTSAEVKVETVDRKVKDTLELVAREHINIETDDPNTTGLIGIIKKLKTKLDNVTREELAAQQQLNELRNRFEDAMTATQEKEQALLAKKEKYQQQVKDIEKSYNELKALMKQTTEQRVQTLMAQLDEEKANSQKLKQELLKTQAELNMTQGRMKLALDRIRELEPLPHSRVAKPDGKIMLVDNQTKIVHLNIGSNDRVYRGLTFSVYDKNMPIPKDGKGKAEIEVFDVERNISAARIIRSEKRRPIVLDDVIANLIWDSDRTNVFVVAGEFDIDSDGYIDYGAADKIKALIEKWGGRVAYSVSIDTDFLVLGRPPEVRPRPSLEEIEIYPMAMEKYEASLQKRAHYEHVQDQARALSIPIFNIERFLYFIGYKSQAGRPGAF